MQRSDDQGMSLGQGVIALKWLWRGLKKGDWLWLLLAVVIASATVTFVERLGDTAKDSMVRKAAMNLGADTVIESSRPIPEDWVRQAKAAGLEVARSTTLVTMAQVKASQANADAGTQFQLVRLKAVSPNTPLRGQGELPRLPKDAHTVWVEQALMPLMGLSMSPPSKLVLGETTFPLAGHYPSDSVGLGMSAFAYEIRIPLAQLAATNLVGPGSRISYAVSVIGPSQAVKQWTQAVRDSEIVNLEVRSSLSPSEDLGQALDTAWQFLDLAGLSAVLVAGLSILIASRFYLTRWQASIALLRALGATRRRITVLFAVQLMGLALTAAVLGVLIGHGLFYAAVPWLRQFFDPLVIAPGVWVSAYGLLMGVLVLWSFAWLAFKRAVATPAISLLKSADRPLSLLQWAGSFVLILAVMALISGGSAWVLAAVAAMTGMLFLAAKGLMWGLQAWQSRAQGWVKLSMAALTRAPQLVTVQLVSIGLVLFVLMLLSFVRADLMDNWQASLPSNTPDTFVANVQPSQVDTVKSVFADKGVDTALVPMARGRLVAVDDTPIKAAQFESQRAQRLLSREANIAVLETPPAYNQITARMPEAARSQLTRPQVSVEQDIAALFGLSLGQVLTFDFSGQRQQYVLTSLRSVTWQSFRLNFFFVVQPQSEQTLPRSYLANFAMAETHTKHSELMQVLAQKAPGVLVIDAGRIIEQIQTIMQQASWAVSGLYGFTLIASLIVLLTATMASQQARVQSWLLLRTLGASRATVLKVGLMEFALLGALAGVLAASFAQLTSVLVSAFVLDMTPQLNPLLWALSVGLGALGLLSLGWVTQRHYIQCSPSQMAQKWT